MKNLISLLLLVSTLAVFGQVPPLLRQRYTTNTQAVVDAYIQSQITAASNANPVLFQKYTTNSTAAVDAIVNGLITTAIAGKANTNITTGSGASVLSNSPVISSATMLGDQTVSNSSLTEVKQVATGGFYRNQILVNGTVQYQEAVISGNYQLTDSVGSRNIFTYDGTSDIMWPGVPFNFTNNPTLLDSPVVGSNLVFLSSQNVPSSQLTNYTIRSAALAIINASNALNFQTFFNPTGNNVTVVNTLITNMSGSARTVSFLGAPTLLWNTAVPTVISNQATALFITRHTSNMIVASWSAVGSISSPPYSATDSNVTAAGFSVQVTSGNTNDIFVVRSNNGTAQWRVQTNGNIIPQANGVQKIGNSGIQPISISSQSYLIDHGGGNGGLMITNDGIGQLTMIRADATAAGAIRWGNLSITSASYPAIIGRNYTGGTPLGFVGSLMDLNGSNGVSFVSGIGNERSTTLLPDAGLKRVSAGWMRLYGTNGSSALAPPPTGNLELSNLVSIGTATAQTLVLTNKTTAPTAATIGANNGWLQCSNGALFYFTTTDGSTLLTTKLTVTP